MTEVEPELATPRTRRGRLGRRTVPVWLALVLGVVGLVGVGWLALRPDLETCEYSREVCEIEHHIDTVSDLRDLGDLSDMTDLGDLGDFDDARTLIELLDRLDK